MRFFILTLLFCNFFVFSTNIRADNISQDLWQIKANTQYKKQIKNIFKKIDQKQYRSAINDAQKLNDNLLTLSINLIIDYKRAENFDLDRLSSLKKQYPFFPNKDINNQIEEKIIKAALSFSEIEKQYPIYNLSNNLQFKLYLIEAKLDFYEKNLKNDSSYDVFFNQIKEDIKYVWINHNLSNEEEELFIDKYLKYLNHSDHIEKIKKLFWEKDIRKVNKFLTYLTEDEEKLFKAIIKIKNNPNTIRKILLSVPRKYRGDELLYYYKVKWLQNKDREEDIIDLLIEVPAKTSYPNYWWNLRNFFGRELLKKKYSQYKDAYKIIANHGLKGGSTEYADAEWSAGWIALRFLNKPQIAYNHFSNLYHNVIFPISISRASYWLGRSSEEFDKNKASYWYRFAMKYPTYFYGQIAHSKYKKLNPDQTYVDLFLPSDPEIKNDNLQNLQNDLALKTAFILAINNNIEEAEHIFKYLININSDKGNIALISKVVLETERSELIHDIFKYLSSKNIFFIKDQYKVIKNIKSEYISLVHALIKQESGFMQSAVSSVGAIGYMQLMPATAKELSKKIGVRYNRTKLRFDMSYNIKLGSHYIDQLLKKFSNSKIMAIASYNAGPNAVKRWIKEFYDPREESDIDKVIDWIELITYSETRNYVQRIIENLIIYEHLMNNQNQ